MYSEKSARCSSSSARMVNIPWQRPGTGRGISSGGNHHQPGDRPIILGDGHALAWHQLFDQFGQMTLCFLQGYRIHNLPPRRFAKMRNHHAHFTRQEAAVSTITESSTSYPRSAIPAIYTRYPQNFLDDADAARVRESEQVGAEQGGKSPASTPAPRQRRRRIDPGEKTRGSQAQLA